jgi:hypothetical protein
MLGLEGFKNNSLEIANGKVCIILRGLLYEGVFDCSFCSISEELIPMPPPCVFIGIACLIPCDFSWFEQKQALAEE